MYVYDAASTGVVAVNDAALECFGYSREEFLAMSVEDIACEASANGSGRRRQASRTAAAPD